MGEAVRRQRRPCLDKVHREENDVYAKGIGREFLCPECGSTFLVTTGEWGYVYKGRKYCRYNCLRAVEKRTK